MSYMNYPTNFENFYQLKGSILNLKKILSCQFNYADCEEISNSPDGSNSNETFGDFNYIILYQKGDKYIVETGITVKELLSNDPDIKFANYYAKQYNLVTHDTIDDALDNFHNLKNSNDKLEHNYFAIKKQTGSSREDYIIEYDEHSEYMYYQGYIYTLDEDVVYDQSIKLATYKNIIKLFTTILNK